MTIIVTKIRILTLVVEVMCVCVCVWEREREYRERVGWSGAILRHRKRKAQGDPCGRGRIRLFQGYLVWGTYLVRSPAEKNLA